jgi:SulP family sulfate permease
VAGASWGTIPAGLPGLGVPALEWSAVTALLPAAFVIALISFMEAMSSCKAIAIKTRVRWDENQELVGQGIAKIAAAFCQSMPVSGSFSRSALNLASGARTGLSSLVTAACVVLTLLFFTPLLYHLPKPVLAAVIMLAVVGLVDLEAFRRSWRASRDDGIAAIATFVATLAFAPNIQNGILTGIIVSLAAYMYGRMRPGYRDADRPAQSFGRGRRRVDRERGDRDPALRCRALLRQRLVLRGNGAGARAQHPGFEAHRHRRERHQ